MCNPQHVLNHLVCETLTSRGKYLLETTDFNGTGGWICGDWVTQRMPGFRGHGADAQRSLRATQCDTGISDRVSYSITVSWAANHLLPDTHQRWEATCEVDDTAISPLSSWEITKSVQCPEGFQLTAAHTHTCFLHQGCFGAAHQHTAWCFHLREL